MSEHHDQSLDAAHGTGGSHSGGHGPGGGGHADGEHEGAPEWLISFADNVALMMGFFVILLAMNMGPKGSTVNNSGEPGQSDQQGAREADFVIGMREAFNNRVSLFSNDPSEAWLRKRILEKEGQHPANDGVPGLAPGSQAVRPGNHDRPAAVIDFLSGSASIGPEAKETLRSLAEKIRGTTLIIEARGYVSTQESRGDRKFAMRLSHDRAFAVADALNMMGVRWDALRVVACGDSDQIVARTENAIQALPNQRVEIVESDEQVPIDPYAVDRTGAFKTELHPGLKPGAQTPR